MFEEQPQRSHGPDPSSEDFVLTGKSQFKSGQTLAPASLDIRSAAIFLEPYPIADSQRSACVGHLLGVAELTVG
jgi:hypothetical protein